jgi:hypothetical protein
MLFIFKMNRQYTKNMETFKVVSSQRDVGSTNRGQVDQRIAAPASHRTVREPLDSHGS